MPARPTAAPSVAGWGFAAPVACALATLGAESLSLDVAADARLRVVPAPGSERNRAITSIRVAPLTPPPDETSLALRERGAEQAGAAAP